MFLRICTKRLSRDFLQDLPGDIDVDSICPFRARLIYKRHFSEEGIPVSRCELVAVPGRPAVIQYSLVEEGIAEPGCMRQEHSHGDLGLWSTAV